MKNTHMTLPCRIALVTFMLIVCAGTRGISLNAEENTAREESREDRYSIVDVGLWPGLSIGFPSSDFGANVSFGLFAAGNRNIQGFQLSLFYNQVEENMYGMQITSGLNNVRGDMYGFQTAGIMNIVKGSFTGIQIAGLVNMAAGTESGGIQAAGIFNSLKGNFIGMQTAGIVNINKGNFTGMQSAGIVNILNGNFSGMQIAGLVNVTEGTVNGMQAAGLVNVAKKVNGVQIGIINIADEVNGIPIGLFNFIKDGIKSPAIYADSGKNLFVQYQSGNSTFYSLFYVGVPWDFSFDHLITGYGFGYRVKAGILSADIDISNKQFYSFKDIPGSGDSGKNGNTDTPSFRVSLNVSPAKHFSIFGGVTLDMDINGRMPEFAHSPWAFGSHPIVMHPTFFAGLKF